MAPSLFKLSAATLAYTAGVSAAQSYILSESYNHTNFFDKFAFFESNYDTGNYNDVDPASGYVNYRSRSDAQALGLISTTDNGEVYIGVDSSQATDPNGKGRSSVRIESNSQYNGGLFIASFSHLPKPVCGSWPAFWMYGPDWPTDGEIDIYENWNLAADNIIALHTGHASEVGSCTIKQSEFSSALVTNNCDNSATNQGDGQGCAVTEQNGQWGSATGGVYATEWTNDAISVWSWPTGFAPTDIDDYPNPSGWGEPHFKLSSQNCDIAKTFSQNSIVLNIDFCGTAGISAFWSSCSIVETCESFVANNPSFFTDVFWKINYINVFQKGTAPTSTSTATATTTKKTTKTTSTTATTTKPASATTTKTTSATTTSKPTRSAASTSTFTSTPSTSTTSSSATSSSAKSSSATSSSATSSSTTSTSTTSTLTTSTSSATATSTDDTCTDDVSTTGYPTSTSRSTSYPTTSASATYSNSSASATYPTGSTSATYSNSSAPSGYTTSTIYSYTTYTITSCASTVTDCPARIGQVTTDIIAVSTTICPITAAQGGSGSSSTATATPAKQTTTAKRPSSIPQSVSGSSPIVASYSATSSVLISESSQTASAPRSTGSTIPPHGTGVTGYPTTTISTVTTAPALNTTGSPTTSSSLTPVFPTGAATKRGASFGVAALGVLFALVL